MLHRASMSMKSIVLRVVVLRDASGERRSTKRDGLYFRARLEVIFVPRHVSDDGRIGITGGSVRVFISARLTLIEHRDIWLSSLLPADPFFETFLF